MKDRCVDGIYSKFVGWEHFQGERGDWPGNTLYLHSGCAILHWSFLRNTRVSLKADVLHDCHISYIPAPFLTRSRPHLRLG